MRVKVYNSGLLWPELFLSALMWFYIPCNAGPTLVSAISITAADFKLSVSAQGLPQFKRLTLTFAYDPTIMDPLAAIVSSPIPSVALGAVLDTSARKLVLNIVATSTISVTDGARLSVISAPLLHGGADENGLRLVSALCIDKDNASIDVSISNQIAAIKRIVNCAPHSAANRPQLPDKVYMLDGRQYPSNRQGAFFVGISRYGGAIFPAMINSR